MGNFSFGGTDGVHWYNDVWIYDPRTNSWTAEDCIGFIPTPREGHAATLCGDVMYVFGGRTEEGKDLGDLAAFRIPTRRWYTFQNMGPSPSPRSGHSMTACGNYIYVVGGEPTFLTPLKSDIRPISHNSKESMESKPPAFDGPVLVSAVELLSNAPNLVKVLIRTDCLNGALDLKRA